MGEEFCYVNKKGKRYYLIQGKTKKGNPRYYMGLKKPDDPDKLMLSEVPEGWEIYEDEKGRVLCRLIITRDIKNEHMEIIKSELDKYPSMRDYIMELTDLHIIIRLAIFPKEKTREVIEKMLSTTSMFRITPQLINTLMDHFVDSGRYLPFLRFTAHNSAKDEYSMELCQPFGGEKEWEFADFGKITRLARQWIGNFAEIIEGKMGVDSLIAALEDDWEDEELKPIRRSRPKKLDQKPRLYTVKVSLEFAPMFHEDYSATEVSRTIQIRGDQTLEELHWAIFEAFDRYDHHMYEFFFGKTPYDRKNIRYTLSMEQEESPFGPDPTVKGYVEDTFVEELGLKKGRVFKYLFDYGDDWLHKIKVLKVGDAIPRGRYPKITERVGDSPPQYPEFEDD